MLLNKKATLTSRTAASQNVYLLAAWHVKWKPLETISREGGGGGFHCSPSPAKDFFQIFDVFRTRKTLIASLVKHVASISFM